MKTYRLPEALGGGEFEEYRHASGSTEAPVGTVAFLVNGCLICVGVALLTEVKPALLEPPNEAAVAVGRQIYRRDDVVADDDDYRWFGAGSTTPSSWAQLNERGTPRLLILDPFGEAIETPWIHSDDDDDQIRVSPSVDINGAVLVGITHAHQYVAVRVPAGDLIRAVWSAGKESGAFAAEDGGHNA